MNRNAPSDSPAPTEPALEQVEAQPGQSETEPEPEPQAAVRSTQTSPPSDPVAGTAASTPEATARPAPTADRPNPTPQGSSDGPKPAASRERKDTTMLFRRPLDPERVPEVSKSHKRRSRRVLTPLSFLPPPSDAATVRHQTAKDPALDPHADPLPHPAHPTLTPPPVNHDSNRLRVLRAITRRTPRELRSRLGREALLQHLIGEASPAETRSSLLQSQAFLNQEQGKFAAADTLRKEAFALDGKDVLLARQLRRAALATRDHEAAAQWLENELELPASTGERAAAASLLATLRAGTELAADTAARAREVAEDKHLPAVLLHASALRANAQNEAAAQALQRAGELVEEPVLKAALALQAGRDFHEAGDGEAALESLRRVREAMPEALLVHLEEARLAQALDRPDVAEQALQRAGDCQQPPTTNAQKALHAALRYLRARLLLAQEAPEAAYELLNEAESEEDHRLRSQAAAWLFQASGRPAPLGDALRGWANAQTGDPRIAALCHLTRHLLTLEETAAAREALEEAERLGPDNLLVRHARNAVLEHKADSADLKRAAELELDQDGLNAVARMVFTDDVAAESALLGRALAPGNQETLQQLQLDAVLHEGALEEARAALRLWADQLASPAGPLLAALDLEDNPPEVRQDLLERLAQEIPHAPAVLAERLAQAPAAAAKAQVWRAFGEGSRGDFAAHGYYLAALLDADADSKERDLRAAVAAHDSPLAAFELYQLFLQRGDDRSQAEFQHALSEQCQGPLQEAKHLYAAASHPQLPLAKRKAWLLRAQQHFPCDDLIGEALLELSPNAPVEERALYLVAGMHPDDWSSQRVTHLRVAAEFERGDRLSEALSHYQHVLQTVPDDPFATAGVVRCLERQGNRNELVEQLQAFYARQEHEAARRRTLVRIQSALRDRSDVTALQSLALILERSSAHVPTLRALERIYGRMGKPALLREAAARLSRQLATPKDRAAYLRLWLRLTPVDNGLERHDEIVLDAITWAENDAPWYALSLEAAARRRRDPATIARAMEYQRNLVTSPEDHACLALRAAEALEPVSLAKAASTLLLPARRTTLHPTAAEELGRLCRAHGDYETAAEAYELAADRAVGRQRKQWLLYLAAVLYQEQLNHLDRARALLERLLQVNPTYLDVLQRLETILRDSGNLRDLARLFDTRIELAGDPATRAQLGLEQHQLYLRSHDYRLAEQALAKALQTCPDRAELLDAQARLFLSRHRYREASEVLLALARRSEKPDELRFALLTLGRLYLHHLPDLKRAEAALVRCLQLDGGDADALEALAELYDRDGRLEQATRVLGRLVELSEDVRDAERYTLRRSELLSRCNRTELARRVLREFLDAHPERLAALRTLVSVHRADQDEAGVHELLAEVGQQYKRAIVSKPTTPTPYLCLRETFRLARRPQAEAFVTSIIDAVCIEAGGFDGGTVAVDTAAIPLDEDAREKLMPPNLSRDARIFLDALCGLMEATHPLPPFPQPLTTTRSTTALQDTLARAATHLRVTEPQLCQTEGPAVHAVQNRPPLLAVGQQAQTSPLVVPMALRALALAEAKLSAVTRMSSTDFALYFYAVRHCLDPHFRPPLEVNLSDALLNTVRRQIDLDDRQRWLERLSKALGPMAVMSPEWLRSAAFQYGTRATLMLSERPHEVFLLALSDDGLTQTPDPLYRHIAHSTTAQQLLSFALSEDYLQLVERARLLP